MGWETLCQRRPGVALCPLGHAADGPHPARELAGRRHVCLVLVDPAFQHGGPPPDEPAHALRGVPPGSRVGGLWIGYT